MSIWHKEVIRVRGDLKAYVEVQNDWTGSITGGLRNIHDKNGHKYVIADTQHIDITEEYNSQIRYEESIKEAFEFKKRFA